METAMNLRSLAASAAIVAASLAGSAIPAFSGDAPRAPETPFTIAATQATAPDFTGLGNWFNSAPLKLADLRGKVVLVNFWTYGCVNCVNTLPHVTALYAKYKDRGFVVVGIHTPEFPFERSASNVQAALKRHGITYPVAQDNDSQTGTPSATAIGRRNISSTRTERSCSSTMARASMNRLSARSPGS